MDNLRSGIIYKYTNKINGKSYIGQTINPKLRKQDHLNRLKKNTGIDTAISKYGADNFEYEVLFETDLLPVKEVKQILNNKEIEFIEKYNTYKTGYNQTKGGGGTTGFPCSEKSKEFRKYYNTHRNELITEETRQKLRDAAYKNYNKRYTQEAREKMSVANRYIRNSELSINKMKNTMENANKRAGVKIDFYDNGTLICSFNSRKECEKYFEGKLKLGVIKTLLSGSHKCRQYPTYELKYKDAKNVKKPSKKQKIVQLTLDNVLVKIWESSQACELEDFKHTTVLACCKHEPHRFSYKGYKWLYELEYNELVGSGQITEIIED